MPLDLARVSGVMPWYWYGKRTEAWVSVLIFATEMLTQKRIPTLSQGYTLESLVGAGHFSYLDLKSGFWQIKMEEMSKQYTTFTVGNLGFSKCNWMPLGLCNAPATFQ